MRKFLALFLAMLTLMLAGCSKEPVTVLTPEEAGLDPELFSDYDYSKFKDEGITLNVANWGEYMSIDEPDMLDVNDRSFVRAAQAMILLSPATICFRR